MGKERSSVVRIRSIGINIWGHCLIFHILLSAEICGAGHVFRVQRLADPSDGGKCVGVGQMNRWERWMSALGSCLSGYPVFKKRLGSRV